MKNRKIFSIVLMTLLLISTLIGCNVATPEDGSTTNGSTPGESTPAVSTSSDLEDGFYYASADSYNNDWKYNVAIEVKDGKVIDAEWSGLSIEGGKDKFTFAADGEYGMIKASTIDAEWNDQSKNTSDFFIENNGETTIEYSNEDGNTDAISGVTFKVKDFFNLADQALNSGPIASGDLEDGYYYNEAEEDNGQTDFVQIVVLNGRIVDANINVLMEDDSGDDSTKKEISLAGDYGMDKVADTPMHEQLSKIENFLVENQNTDVNYIDDEKTDSITGATIGVKDFFELVDGAIKGKPEYPIFK